MLERYLLLVIFIYYLVNRITSNIVQININVNAELA